jgi:glycosyltransferase involved in cell wall biosynthesis
MPANTLISVIIPTHNRQQDLKKALASVFCQTVLPCEVIVVDDGSKPKVTRDIFANAPEDMQTTLLRNKEPKGAPHARNRGIKAAKGTWIAFLDDDDQFKPHKIEKIVQHIKENPECDLVYHPAEIHMVNENVSYISNPRKFFPEDDIFRCLLIKNEIGGTSMVIIKKNILLNAGMFDDRMPALQDYALWIQIARVTTHFSLISIPLTKYHYISKKSSISKSINTNQNAIRLIEDKYIEEYKYFSDNEKIMHEQWKWKMLVHKSLLNGNILLACKFQFKRFLHSPSIYNLLSICIIFLGLKNIYKIKKRIS